MSSYSRCGKSSKRDHFLVVVRMLHKLVLTFESVDQLDQPYFVTIQLKATELYFAVVLCIVLHEVVVTLKFGFK